MEKKRPIRILVTDNQPLAPLVAGARLRIHHLYRNLARHFVITYVGAYDWLGPPHRERGVAPNFTEITVPLAWLHFRLNSIIQRFVGREMLLDVTMPLLRNYAPRFAEVLNRHTKDAQIIIISRPWVFPYVEWRRDQLLIYDAHNCESLAKKDILGDSLVGRSLADKVTKIEGQLCRVSRLIFACSEEDRNQFIDTYGIDEDKILIIPNGVDVGQIRPASRAERETAKREIGMNGKKTILFVGSWNKPNAESVEFIVKVLAPQLLEYQFLIVGGAQQAYLRLATGSTHTIPVNVRFFGTVDEPLRDTIYRASDIALNPMFTGSGTNIKMLDYMAAGLPVITTPRGARGIEAPHHTFMVCEASDFAMSIKMILENEEMHNALRQNGRKLVEVKFDWKLIAEKAYSVIEAYLGQGSRPDLLV